MQTRETRITGACKNKDCYAVSFTRSSESLLAHYEFEYYMIRLNGTWFCTQGWFSMTLVSRIFMVNPNEHLSWNPFMHGGQRSVFGHDFVVLVERF